MLMIGEPGCGKTMIAQRIPTILPEMTEAECLEVTKIYSISGILPNGHGLIRHMAMGPRVMLAENISKISYLHYEGNKVNKKYIVWGIKKEDCDIIFSNDIMFNDETKLNHDKQIRKLLEITYKDKNNGLYLKIDLFFMNRIHGVFINWCFYKLIKPVGGIIYCIFKYILGGTVIILKNLLNKQKEIKKS